MEEKKGWREKEKRIIMSKVLLACVLPYRPLRGPKSRSRALRIVVVHGLLEFFL